MSSGSRKRRSNSRRSKTAAVVTGDGAVAVVLDNGSHSIKAGMAGTAAPRACVSSTATTSAVGRDKQVGSMAQAKRSIASPAAPPMQHGIIVDWNAMEKLWHHTLYEQLSVAPEDQPMMMTCRPNAPKTQRRKIREIMFETFSVPALQLEYPQVCAMTAMGRDTGLIFDIGHGYSAAVPVVDNTVIHDALLCLDLAGADLDAYLARMMAERGHEVSSKVAGAVKEAVCFLSLDIASDAAKATKDASVYQTYQLPDGQSVSLGAERFRCVEPLFSPMIMGITAESVSKMCVTSIERCSKKHQPTLYQSILVTGGSSLIPGFADRFHNQLGQDLSPSITRNVVMAEDPINAAWIGAAALALQSTYQNSWMTRAIYDERGA